MCGNRQSCGCGTGAGVSAGMVAGLGGLAAEFGASIGAGAIAAGDVFRRMTVTDRITSPHGYHHAGRALAVPLALHAGTGAVVDVML